MPHTDIWTFILHANIVVKIILLILLAASVTSWTIIFQKAALLKQRKESAKRFEGQFFSKMPHQQLYNKLKHKQKSLYGLGRIYFDAYNAFKTCKEKNEDDKQTKTQVMRTLRISHTQEVEHLEKHLSLLATIGSNAVYVGLLGTVWGVMSAFEGLSMTAQATIASVAPGIAEALIATALGLIVAIPAVIAYNLFNARIENIETMYHIFQDEFMTELTHNNILQSDTNHEQ